jgi:periplasmic divalent cation tolerance protein
LTDALVVLTTIEKSDEGEILARLIIDSGLAACVQILPPITSMYRWEGKVEKANETLLLIKTTRVAYPALEKLIIQNHSYKVPEIISLPVEKGLKDYLDWLTTSMRKFE